jgi:hypothetical protein
MMWNVGAAAVVQGLETKSSTRSGAGAGEEFVILYVIAAWALVSSTYVWLGN